MRKLSATKIVSTLGPASNNEDMIRKLYRAGVTMFRINSSHGDHSIHQKNLDYIREIEKEEHTLIPVLLDLQGPKIRVGELKESLEIKKDEILKFRHGKELKENIIPVDYEGLAKDVKIGEKFLIDDGKLQFEVTEINNDVVSAKVLTGGILKQRKGIINLNL